jgi:hypothetical protein
LQLRWRNSVDFSWLKTKGNFILGVIKPLHGVGRQPLVIVLAKGSGWCRLIKGMKSVEHTTSEFSTRKKKRSRLQDTRQFGYIQTDVK